MTQWDLASGAAQRTAKIEGVGGMLVRTLPSRNQAAFYASVNEYIAVWDLDNFRAVRRIEVQKYSRVDISPNAKWIAIASEGVISIRDFDSLEELQRFDSGDKTLLSLQFSPDSKILVASTPRLQSKLCFWDTNVWQPIPQWKGPEIAVRNFAFHPTRHWIAIWSVDGFPRIWDPAAGKTALELSGIGDMPSARLAFSPDGSRLAAACSDLRVRLWDMRTGSVILTLNGPPTGATGFEFSPTGQHLALSAIDSTIWTSTSRDSADLPQAEGGRK